MKKLFVLFIIFLSVVVFISFSKHNNSNAEVSIPETQEEMHYSQQLSTITSAILNMQHATALSKLDCNKITNEQFFSLGNSFMDMAFGSEHINEQIKKMNTQQTITQSYIQLGRYYLTCPNVYTKTFPSPQTQQHYGEAFYKTVHDVLHSQHVSSIKQLNCNKLTDKQLIDVGDSQMDLMVGNETVHAKVDKLFGKNIKSLELIHIEAGKIVLGCI